MSEKEEEFPFDQFVEALAEAKNLRKSLKSILDAIAQKNIYWAYSAISTLVQIIKSKEEEPFIKCRAIQVMTILFETCQYPVVIFVEVYVVPILLDIANYRGKKSEQALGYYFLQTQRSPDNQQNRKYSTQFIQRGVQLLFFASKIKPNRTVQTQQIKELSVFGKTVNSIKDIVVVEPKKMKWCQQDKQKQYRKLFLKKLKKFSNQSEEWTQFLLVNLLEEVQTGKKELLQLRLLVGFGESFLTSAVINFCEEELMDISQSIDLKRKYLALLHQLVRYGDIEAIIMVKNSQFVPNLFAYISKFPGHQGLNVGENLYPQIKASKQIKKQFYCDFLRCLQTWATCMPDDYDSDDFNIKTIYNYLKKEKKFKFPQNMLLTRFQKQIKENLVKNQERNDKLLEILEEADVSRQPSTTSKVVGKSKVSNVLQKTTLLATSQLEIKLDQIKKVLKQLTINQQSADKAFKILVSFKDNWITYLESIDFDGTDEAQLQNIVSNGQRLVQQIQLIVPLHANLQKGKLSFRQYKNKVSDTLEFHMDVSHTSINNKSAMEKSKSYKISKLIQSKNGKSKLGASKMGKSILEKIKAKSRMGDITKLNMSKAMDRSNMLEKSRYLDKSRNNVMETSMKKTPKKIENKQETPQNSDSQTERYSIQQKLIKPKDSQKKEETPNKSKASKQMIHDKPTTKKQPEKQKKPIKDSDSQDQRVVKIADYEAEPQPSKRPSRLPRGSSRDKSQNSGSRILLRRTNSRLDRSSDSESRISVGRRSISNRKVKESSLKNQIEHEKTRKISETSAHNISGVKQQTPCKNNIPETPVKQKEYEKSSKGFDKFNEEAGEISSIYSDSNIRPNFQIEKAARQISQIQYSKQIVIARERKEELVEYVTKGFDVAPLVGDYYEDNKNKNKPKVQKPKVQSPKKKTYEEQKTIEKSTDSLKFKNIFKNEQYMDKKQIKPIKKIQKPVPSSNPVKTEPMKESRHTTKNIPLVSEFDIGQNKTRNSVKQIEPYYSEKVLEAKLIQEEKNKQIMALQQKIKQLQRQSYSMKKRLAARDSELRSIKGSNASSQKGFAQFTVTSGSNFDKTSLRSSSASRRVEMTQFQKEVQSGFKQYLQRFKGNTFKKSLLKLKCLVHRTDQVQIGCLSQRCQNTLESTLYVTPHRYDMIDFSLAVIHDHRLRIKVTPESVKLIPALKQQKVHLTIQVLNIPFCLPQFQINYKSDSEYCSSYSRLALPLGFNKFCSIKPLDFTLKNERHIDYVKTDNFRLNNKVLKADKLSDSFASFTIVPASKGRDCMLVGASCSFGDSFFNVILNVGEKWCWWEGFLLKGESKAMNFFICSLKEMIDGSKK